MQSDRQHFSDLLRKHINGQLSEDDTTAFDKFLNSVPEEEQRELFYQVWQEVLSEGDEPVQTFSDTEKKHILDKVLQRDSPAKISYPSGQSVWRGALARYMVAAVMLLTIGVGLFLYSDRIDAPVESLANNNSKQDVEPGTDRAILLTEDGEEITLDSKQVGVIKSSQSFNIVRLESGEIQYQSTGQNQSPQRHTVRTPRGGQINFLLPDGSKVWLNTASSLTFSSNMTTADRVVDMTGEVYFEVVKRQGQRFVVNGHFGQIDVLGTKFNVNAYDRALSTTALLEGSVQLESSTAQVRMYPDQLAKVRTDGRIVTARVDNINNHISWKDGFFYFDHADAYSIAAQLSRWYDIEVVVQSTNPHQEFTGTVSRKIKLSQMIEMLDYLGIKSKYLNNKLIIL
ncbi:MULTISPECIES: FecR family protein [Sphingobacterium]|uniref:FecR family protein n=1 Tax=Sphingobacterium TaxID=28453 RepID=UPI0013D93411|nr:MULTISPECIES: FecR family protein [unclassified Sphingobacterium]